MKAYHIKDWNVWYESSETRKLKTLTYYGKPNKLVGEGIGHTLAQDDNVALLGTWALLEAFASTSERELRGWLIRNGTPQTAARMAALIGGRVPAATFQRALDHFASPEVGWLEYLDMPGQTAGLFPATPPNSTETGTPPGESPGTLPATATGEREVGRDSGGERGNQEGGSRLPASHLPSSQEIETFAAASGVPLDYARAKIKLADERKDFEKPGWRNGWQEKLKRFWKDDAAEWGKSKKTRDQKNRAGANGLGGSPRPDGWMEGDRDRWWTDDLASVQAELSGAVLAQNEKTAARLRQIISERQK
jgi:hypothetical protein